VNFSKTICNLSAILTIQLLFKWFDVFTGKCCTS
jgi:hypothetical protein